MDKDTKENLQGEQKLKSVKNKNFFTAMHHSVDGVIKAFKTERNLRIDYFIAVCVLIASIILGFSKVEFVCLCLTIGFVLFSEMMNSVAEYIVDLVTDKYDDRAKAAKDIAAGGVLISATISIIVAFMLFLDKLQDATSSVLNAIFSSNANIMFTMIFMMAVLVIILKGFLGRGKEYAHSGPSLYVTLAFGLSTYACIITRSFLVGAVCGMLSLMIFGMKIENPNVKKINMIYSGLLGILIVLIVYELVLIGPSILAKFNF